MKQQKIIIHRARSHYINSLHPSYPILVLTKREKSKNISSKKGNTKPLINKLEFINTKLISQKLRQGF